MGSMLQLKIKVANNIHKVTNKTIIVAKTLLQVANTDISYKYFFKLAKKSARVANIYLQVQISCR